MWQQSGLDVATEIQYGYHIQRCDMPRLIYVITGGSNPFFTQVDLCLDYFWIPPPLIINAII